MVLQPHTEEAVFLYDVHAQRKRGGQPEAVLVLGTSACSMRLAESTLQHLMHTLTLVFDRLHLCLLFFTLCMLKGPCCDSLAISV